MKHTTCTDCGTTLEKKPRGRPALRCAPCRTKHRTEYLKQAQRRSRARRDAQATTRENGTGETVVYPGEWAHLNPNRSE